MNALLVFFFFISLVAYKCLCEKLEILPLGDIISGVNTATELLSNKNSEDSTPMLEDSPPKINIQIVPSKRIRITKDDMNFLLSELKQEINRQMNMLEDELDEKERMRQRSSSTWSMNESAVYVPNNESADINENEVLQEDEQAEAEELLNSINEIANEDENIKENRTYNIEIKDNVKPEESSSDNASNFRQKSFRNGPVEQ